MGENICSPCAMCCSGNLFSRVPIEAKEQAVLDDRANVFMHKGNMRMSLPCQLLKSNGDCSVYENRPGGCQSYRCDLLRKLDSDAVSGEVALDIIEEAKTCVARLKSDISKALPESMALDFEQPIYRVVHGMRDARKMYPDLLNSFWADQAELHFSILIDIVRANFEENYLK